MAEYKGPKLKKTKDNLNPGKYKTFFDNSPGAIFICNPQCVILEVNKTACLISGYSQKELLSMGMQQLSDPESNDLKELFSELNSKGSLESEIIIKTKSGKSVHCSFDAVTLDNNQFLIFCFDITDRKTAEQAVKENEIRYRNIVDSSLAGMHLYELEEEERLIFIGANPAADRILGVDNKIFIGKTIEEAFPPLSETEIPEKYRQVAATGITWSTEQIAYEEGKIKGAFAVSAFKTGKNKMVAMFTDITESKKAEDELRREKEFTDHVLNSQNDTFFLFDPSNGKAIRWNQSFNDISGYTDDEISKMRAPDSYYSQDDLSRVGPAIQEILKTGRGVIEIELICKNGRKVPTEYNVSTIQDKISGKTYLISVGRDVTERKLAETEREKLQAQLIQSQKMESIGTLAGGIAHNFNNILMGIQGHTSLMSIDKGPSHPDFEHLQGIEKSVKNAVDLTQQLLGFARGGKYEVKPLDVNALINHESKIFSKTRKEIEIRENLDKNLWSIEADKGQLQQVMLNLFINAWQAMDKHGSIQVKTENVTVDQNAPSSPDLVAGRYVKISVTDSGKGMDEKTRQKVFDPFFTTKDLGQGSGLGLASTYGIIRNHKGFIQVKSQPDKGATFEIYLPASDKKVCLDKEENVKIYKGQGKILFIDDEPEVLAVGTELLQVLGYDVLGAGSGKMAVEIYQKYKDEIVLVILDLIMPVMSGHETFRKIQEIKPGTPVILSSGYSLDGQADIFLSQGVRGFLQKPFSLDALSKRIRESLGDW